MISRWLTFVLLLWVCIPKSTLGASPPTSSWHLIWADEFDGPTVDETKWRVEDAALVKNNEMQYYAPDEVYIENGCLVLRSRARKMGGRDYTSGLVETRDRFDFLYGRVEVRAQLPRTQGLWPAHWMLPADGSWPPEIDIMESVGSQPNWIVMSLHNGKWPALDTQSGEHLGSDYSADFHVFALEWEPRELRWYIDGNVCFSTTNGIPRKPFYIILNTAVGGDMPGAPDETTVFPQYHRIDYVRVYGRLKPGSFFVTAAARNGRVRISPANPEHRYPDGAVLSLKATPSIGWTFSSWSGDAEGNDNPLTYTVSRHAHIVAVFEPDPNAPQLLSRGARATSSSIENDDLTPDKAFDGDRKTRWSSAFADPQWIMADLGAEHVIEAFRLVWENAYARKYQIEVSQDGQSWTPVHAKDGCRGGTEEIIKVNQRGRFVRLVGLQRATTWGYSLWEFEVYGR